MTATTDLPAAVPSVRPDADRPPGALWQRTPHLILGPFYPVARAATRAAEMAAEVVAEVVAPGGAARSAHQAGAVAWLETDRPAHATGPQALHISGRVHNRAGQPVARALVELWHADESGRYAHPSAAPPTAGGAAGGAAGGEALGTAFVGYGALRSGTDGGYAFHSRTPGAYAEAGQQRAPHLHFQVTGVHDRLITQVFFPGDELNAHDHWYRAVARPHQIVATLVHETPALLQLRWDIVLSTG